jgi:PKD repeat protein/glucose/arabinose dehydrogenase
LVGLLAGVVLVLLTEATPAATTSTLPTGFEDQAVLGGLTNPTVARFSPDGRVFVAEKSGLIKVFDSLSDPTPDIFADLRTNVYNFWDRGLLGLALAPGFPADPYVYVLYTYDHVLGDSAAPPKWGQPGVTSDPCPTPPGATTDGCVVSGRLSRLQASGNSMVGSEQVLIEDWCQQYPSHSVGTIEFGPDGKLYASGGEGASFNFVDWGQDGNPINPCGDPPGGIGGAETPPTAEGGALRSQDLRTPADPTTLDGALLRVEPATGAAASGNPLISSSDLNARRIIAYGLRNPFRFTFRPGSSEIWVGDVGGGGYEEIDRITSPTDSNVENFGWPCYEGPGRESGFDAANLSICENLYADPQADTKSYFSYAHASQVVPGESCATGSSSISGLSFAFSGASSPYPATYDDALFFADYSRNCIWVMKKGGNGLPAPGLIDTFVASAAAPVELERGPNGEIYYVDFTGGTIRRIHYVGTQTQPYPDAVTADSPQLYWRLGQTSGSFTDASGHGNDGVGGGTGILRGQPDVVNANSDGSVKFTDAASNITLASPSGLSSSAVSAEVWFKTGAQANWIDLLSHNWGGTGGQGYALFSDASGTAYFGIWQSGGTQQLLAAPGLQTNTVYHLVGTYDGNVMRLYVNGALVGSKTVGALTLNTSASVFTGRVDTTAGVFMDELAVYNTALSATRVQAHYNAGAASGGTNQPPTAAARATPTSGPAPLTVNFSGTGSTDPEGGALTYAWDLDGDGQYDDSTSATPTFTYTSAANVTVGLKVTDNGGATDTESVLITVTSSGGGGTYPDAVTADSPQLYWRLGQTSGSFTDASGHGNDGVGGGTGILRGQPDVVNANSDGSVKFTDAASNITLASPSGLSSSAVSAEVWFKTGAQANWIDLLSHNWGGTGGQGYALFSDASGTAYFGIWQSGGTQQLLAAPGLQTNTVYHLVGTYDGNVMRLYVNGALVGSKTVGALTLNTSASVFTGRVDTTAGVFMDELAVYNTALSATRVQAHYNAGAASGGTNQPPTAAVSTPSSSLAWKVGDTISFSGSATDPEDGQLPASALHWDILIQHCPSNCHTHLLQTFDGVSSGSFSAPDHEYPSHLEIKLTATDSQNATGTASVSIQPKTVTVSMVSTPPGLQLSVNSNTAAAPFTQTVIQGSNNTISAPDQTLSGTSYTFASWSDGGAASHNVVANANATYTATFQASSAPTYSSTVLADNPLLYWRLGESSGTFADSSGHGNAGAANGSGFTPHAPDLVAANNDGALTFTDGTSNVSCPSIASLSSSTVSVEVWFKTAAFANYLDLASHNWGGPNGSGWSIYVASNHQLFWGLKASGSAEASAKIGGLNPNTVYHVVGTYDGNVLRIYLNGVQVATKTVGAKALNTSAGLLTGQMDTTAGVTVDEVAIYGSALSASLVQAHYAARS